MAASPFLSLSSTAASRAPTDPFFLHEFPHPSSLNSFSLNLSRNYWFNGVSDLRPVRVAGLRYSSLHRRVPPLRALQSDVPCPLHPIRQAQVSLKNSESYKQWDSLTATFSAAANIPFLLLQLPQIILNARNLMAGNKTALLAVPWMIMWSTFVPYVPNTILPGIIAFVIAVTAVIMARTGRLSEKGAKFVGGLSGWTATLLFMWMPVSQMVVLVTLSFLSFVADGFATWLHLINISADGCSGQIS